MNIIGLLRQARGLKASDVHLLAGSRPVFRIHGVLTSPEEAPVLTSDDIQQSFERMAGSESVARFQRNPELDFSFSIPNCGRFRCNVARQMGTITMVIRVLPPQIPNIDDLGVPPLCRDLIRRPNGLIILSGPTGSGKSTTLAAMIDHLNRTGDGRGRRVVTVEDPVEYVYGSENCIITQRELGTDTQSFVEALRHVLRQDPDIILIGEMRDTDTAAAALTIAETGHLVLTTGHAPSAPGAVERIIDLFPPHERPLVQTRLASLLQAVLCQALVPRADQPGRVVAVEVMLANPAVRNIIREGKIYQLPNVIRTHQHDGMQLLDHALIRLFRDGLINSQNMFAFCNDKDEVERTLANSSGAAAAGVQAGIKVAA
jgi:twitching motility protein PilT